MYSDSGASADMNLKSLTQLLQDCGGEELGIFVFFSSFTVIYMTESPRQSLSDEVENFCACSHIVWL